jgi:hypothetical protein
MKGYDIKDDELGIVILPYGSILIQYYLAPTIPVYIGYGNSTGSDIWTTFEHLSTECKKRKLNKDILSLQYVIILRCVKFQCETSDFSIPNYYFIDNFDDLELVFNLRQDM